MPQLEDQNPSWLDEDVEEKVLNRKVLLIALSIFIFTLSGILFFFTSSDKNTINEEEMTAQVLHEAGITHGGDHSESDTTEGHDPSTKPIETTESDESEAETPEKDTSENEVKDIDDETTDITKEEVISNDIFDEEGDFVFSNDLFDTYSDEKIEEILRKILDNQEDPIIAMDTGTNISFASSDYLRLTGFKADELKGKTFYEHVHNEDVQAIMSSITQLSLEGDSMKIGPYRIIANTGVVQMHVGNAIIVRDSENKPIQILMAIENVSDKISITNIPNMLDIMLKNDGNKEKNATNATVVNKDVKNGG